MERRRRSRRGRKRQSKLQVFAISAAGLVLVGAFAVGTTYQGSYSRTPAVVTPTPESYRSQPAASRPWVGHANPSYTGDGALYFGTDAAMLAEQVPPPPESAAVKAADRRAYEETRSLKGSKRWQMAEADTDLSTESLLKDFSCASGVALTPERAPKLASVLRVAKFQTGRVATIAKKKFPRARPFDLYGGPTCDTTEKLNEKADYPSGHSARAWSFALVLADLMPDREAKLRARAKAFGESRVICGFHSPTGVEGGRAIAALTVDALEQDPKFKEKMAKAAEELSALKQQGDAPPASQCAAEAALFERR